MATAAAVPVATAAAMVPESAAAVAYGQRLYGQIARSGGGGGACVATAALMVSVLQPWHMASDCMGR